MPFFAATSRVSTAIESSETFFRLMNDFKYNKAAVNLDSQLKSENLSDEERAKIVAKRDAAIGNIENKEMKPDFTQS